jgi:hypothetical protein
MRAVSVVLRIAGVGLIVAAVVAQLSRSIQVWAEAGVQSTGTQVANFFSFFTIDSNLLTLASFAVGVVIVLRGSGAADALEPHGWTVFRACVTAYMATTGIVYNTLLRGIELPQGTTVPWSNEILHVVGPVLAVADWLLSPGRNRLDWKHIGWVVSFPLVWTVYTMIRGPLVVDEVSRRDYWYPYPFLNPNTAPEGYVSVLFYMVLIAAVIGGVGAAAIWVTRRGRRWPLPETA